MKRRFYIYSLLCCLIISCFDATAESNTLDFIVFRGKEQIGTLTVHRIKKDQRTTYRLTSSVKIGMIVDFDIMESITDVFENGLLTTSRHTRHVNGTLKANNTLEKNAGQYKLTNTNDDVKYLGTPIQYSVLTLYFHEPSLNQAFYSQNFQLLFEPKKIEPHTYMLELPNGNKTTYSYKLGKLSEVASQTRFGIIKFVPRS